MFSWSYLQRLFQPWGSFLGAECVPRIIVLIFFMNSKMQQPQLATCFTDTDVNSFFLLLFYVFSVPTGLVQGSDPPGFISPHKEIADKTEKGIQDLSGLHAPANARRSARTKNHPRNICRPSIYKIPPHLQLPSSPQTPLEAINLARSGASESEQGCKEDSGRSSYSGGGHFHFSIYKWASTEIALVMPYNLKNRKKSASKVSGGSAQNLPAATRPIDNGNVSQEGRVSHTLSKESVNQFNGISAAGDLDKNLKKDAKKLFRASSAKKSDRNDIHDKSGKSPSAATFAYFSSMGLLDPVFVV